MEQKDAYYSNYRVLYSWKGRAHETAYRLIQAQQNGDSETARVLEAQLKIEVKRRQHVLFRCRNGRGASRHVEKSGASPARCLHRMGKIAHQARRTAHHIGKLRVAPRRPAHLGERARPIASAWWRFCLRANCCRWFTTPPKKAWEARFDVPTYAREGAYNVKIIIVAADGARRQMTMTFRVDVTAPDGKGGVMLGEGTFNLRLETDEQTRPRERVYAVERAHRIAPRHRRHLWRAGSGAGAVAGQSGANSLLS